MRTTSPFPSSHLLSLTVWVLYLEGHKLNPSWCLAVKMIPFAPASFATRTHWLQSSSVGAKTVGSSLPSPHSLSVKVLGPKCINK